MSSTSTSAALLPTSILFARGVIALLKCWPALQIAVDQEWGGPQSAEKRTWIASVIVDGFEEQDPLPDDQYIEELLLQIMEDEFMANLEDGSAEGVAKDIVGLWEDVHAGKQDLVARFEEQADALKGKMPQVEEVCSGSDWDDDGDDVESEEEAPQLLDREETAVKDGPQVDEDGFTLVQSKTKARR